MRFYVFQVVEFRVQPCPMRGLNLFFLLLGVLVVLMFGITFIPVETAAAAKTWSYLFTPFLIAIPVYAIFSAANHKWSWQLALQFILIGALAHVSLAIMEKQVQEKPLLAAFSAIGQAGLLMWTMGLGALLATRLKDKNLLIPVSIFLISFDIFLVFTPNSPLQKLAPKYLSQIAYKVTQAGSVQPFAFVGPADFLFMGMFFVALYHFHMDPKSTVKWMIVAILVYLCLQMFGLAMLPLMVPIGLTVLLVNWRFFKLNKEEISSTAVIAVICVALISYMAWKRASQPAPSISAQEGEIQGSETKPAPTSGGPLPSGSPTVPEGTPNPQ